MLALGEELQSEASLPGGEISFATADRIFHEIIKNGVGAGIHSVYEGFSVGGQQVDYAFATLVWVEAATEHVFFEWIPLREEGLHPERVLWLWPHGI